MIFRNQGSLIKKSNSISRDKLIDLYGLNSYEFTQMNKEEIFVCSKNKNLDLIELFLILKPAYSTQNKVVNCYKIKQINWKLLKT